MEDELDVTQVVTSAQNKQKAKAIKKKRID